MAPVGCHHTQCPRQPARATPVWANSRRARQIAVRRDTHLVVHAGQLVAVAAAKWVALAGAPVLRSRRARCLAPIPLDSAGSCRPRGACGFASLRPVPTASAGRAATSWSWRVSGGVGRTDALGSSVGSMARSRPRRRVAGAPRKALACRPHYSREGSRNAAECAHAVKAWRLHSSWIRLVLSRRQWCDGARAENLGLSGRSAFAAFACAS